MRLPNDEWLMLAKGTAVGTQRRARHRGEGRENMVVGNTPDRWWAYCQACRAGAVEMKQHVIVGGAAPKDSTSMIRPADARGLMQLEQHERDALSLLMARKSMDWLYFGATKVEWSASRHRLLIHTPSGVMGRDTTERSPQKWLTYDRQHYLAAEDAHPDVVLVEDTFSYYKVRHALTAARVPCAVVCTLGTSIHDSLFLWLLKNARRVWSFYDGDAAGWRGSGSNAKRLRAADLYGGGGFIESCATTDNDPKDMTLMQITTHVARLLATSKEQPT